MFDPDPQAGDLTVGSLLGRRELALPGLFFG